MAGELEWLFVLVSRYCYKIIIRSFSNVIFRSSPVHAELVVLSYHGYYASSFGVFVNLDFLLQKLHPTERSYSNRQCCSISLCVRNFWAIEGTVTQKIKIEVIWFNSFVALLHLILDELPQRHWAIIASIVFTFGCIVPSLISYLLPRWNDFMLAMAVISALYIPITVRLPSLEEGCL